MKVRLGVQPILITALLSLLMSGPDRTEGSPVSTSISKCVSVVKSDDLAAGADSGGLDGVSWAKTKLQARQTATRAAAMRVMILPSAAGTAAARNSGVL